jgi:hypothetical protein
MQNRPSWLFALTVAACAGQLVSPLHAQGERGPQVAASQAEHSEATEPLPNCMASWYADGRITKAEWLEACEHEGAEAPNYNVDSARCLSDWNPETHMTKREWLMRIRRVRS